MRKKICKVTAALVLILVFISAIGALAAPKEITFLAVGYTAAMRKYVQDEVIPVFRQRFDTDVVLLNANWNNRMERFMVLTAGGTPPDVICTGSYSPYEEGSLGLLAPLDRYLAEWKYTNRFPDTLWEALKWDGKVVVVPQNVAPRAIGYNKELFAQSGLDPNNPPQDWPSLIQAARRITRLEGDSVAVRGFVTTTAGGAAQQLFWFMRQAGLPEIDMAKFTSNLMEPGALAALETLHELYQAGANDSPLLAGGFADGRIAMQYSNPQQIVSMLAVDPDFLLNDFALFAPRMTPTSMPVAHLFTDGLAIPSASRNKDLAWECIALMMSDVVSLETLRVAGVFCGRTDMLQRMMSTQPRIELWYDIFPYMQASIIPPPRDVSQIELGRLIDRVYKLEMAPLTALEQAHTLWNRLLNEWKAEIVR